MPLMLLSPPLGVIAGYIMTAIIILKSNWHISFLIQGLTILILALLILIFPS